MPLRVEIPIVVLNPIAPYNPVAAVNVSIFDREDDGTAGSLATVYQNADPDDPATLSQPGIQTDTEGRVDGWLARGKYLLEFTLPSRPTTQEAFDAAPGGDGGIDTDWVADDAITTAKVLDSAITTAKIADGTILNVDVDAAAAIAYSKLNLTGSIVNADVNASAAIALSKLATVSSAQLLLGNNSGVVTGTALSGDATITNAGVLTIANDAINAAKLANNAVDTNAIIDLNVTTGKIADSAITSLKIADGAIVNADVNASAAIAYNKLALTGSIVNADVSGFAQIAHSKLADTSAGRILMGTTTTGVITATVLSGDATIIGDGTLTIANSAITNAKVSASAAIAYSKLNLSGSIVNADVNASAAIAYSKLTLTGSIVNADVASGAAIALAKLATGSSAQVPIANGVDGTLTYRTLTGDVTISSGGATSIGSGVVTNTMLAGSIALTKLAAITPGNILIGTTTTGVVTERTLSGDATVSATGVLTVANSAVTLAKMADIATDRLIGRDTAGTGVPEALTVGGGIEFTGSAGIQRSALTGDVTASAGSGSTTISAGVVTLAKMANISTDRLIGRDTAGTGVPEAITVSNGIEFDGSGGLQRSALTGDVTASAGSNATTIANSAVTSAKIADATIVGADISGSAQIAHSKLADTTPGRILLGTTTSGVVTATALSGDATIIGDGTLTIASGAVSLAKMANITTDTLVGRDTIGSGVPEAIAVSGGLEFTGSGGIQRSALTGDITATAGSNATTLANSVVTNAKVSASAAIVYSKLNLSGGIVNADVNASAAIAYSKLSLTGGVVNADISGSAAIAHSKLADTTPGKVLMGTVTSGVVTATTLSGDATLAGDGTLTVANSAITNAKVAALAAISYSKLNLSASIVNADVNASAAITYSKLNLSGSIVNADISSSAAIVPSKIANAASAQMLVAASDGTWTARSLSGDITVSDTGVVTVASISGGSVGSQSITLDKIVRGGSAQILVGQGAGADIAYETMSGDATLSSGGALTIANGAVGLAKLANVATDRLLGRDTAGTGVPEALTVSGGIEFTGSGGIQRSALTGDVTASAGSNATTIASNAVVTAKIADDNVTYAKIQNLATDRLLGRDTAASGDAEELTVGGGVEFTGAGGIQRSALTGDVTASAGSNATTVANGAITDAKIAAATGIQLSKLATTGTFQATTLQISGNVGFNGQTPASRPDYTVTNGTTDRTFDANNTTLDELADIVATMIADNIAIGLYQ